MKVRELSFQAVPSSSSQWRARISQSIGFGVAAVFLAVSLVGSTTPATAAGRAIKVLTTQTRVSLIGPGTAPVISAGNVFLSAQLAKVKFSGNGTNFRVYAFNKLGRLLWSKTVTANHHPTNVTAVAVSQGVVYAGWFSREFCCRVNEVYFYGGITGFKIVDGTTVFASDPGLTDSPGATSTPVISNGNIYSNFRFEVGGGVTSTQAYSVASGAALFQTDARAGTPSGPLAVYGNSLYVPDGNVLNVFPSTVDNTCGFDLAFDPWHLFPRFCPSSWSLNISGTWKIRAAPIVASGSLFVGGTDGKLYAFSASGCGMTSCTPLWTATTDGPIVSSLTSNQGTVFVTTQNGTLYAYPVGGCSNSTCAPLWKATPGGSLTKSVIFGTSVYVGSSNGRVFQYAISGCGSATCTPSLIANVGTPISSEPAIGLGRLFVSDEQATLHIFKLP